MREKQTLSKTNETLELELTAFQGPFDLLLHLIREMKVDIHDIPMAEVTEQYMAYIHRMQELELDLIADYLVMAATLIEIKARLLLPIEPDTLEGDFEEDPRQVLVQHLLIYQQFQQVSDQLEDLQMDRSKQYTGQGQDLSAYQVQIPLLEGELSLDQLLMAMGDVLQRELKRQPLQKDIVQDRVSVADKITFIRQAFEGLDAESGLEFSDLLQSHNRYEIIATFMAVLEMVRKQEIIFNQASNLTPIELRKNPKGGI